MLKTRLTATAGLALILAAVAAPVASADTWNDFEYTYQTGGTATITGYTGDVVTELALPEVIGPQGFAVTAIADDAFADLRLTKVTLPDYLITIGERAFLNSEFTDLTIPDEVTDIGTSAFYYSPLTSLHLGKNVVNIGTHSFLRNDLTELTIPEHVEFIGMSAFMTSSLSNITIPASVEVIGQAAFRDSGFDSITFDGPVASIGYSAFSAPSRNGYDFQGWFDAPVGGIEVTPFPSAITQARTIYSQWSIQQRTVTFDPQNGDDPTEQNVDYGSQVEPPSPEPFLAGHTFKEWVDGDVEWPWDFDTAVNWDTYLTAVYTANTTAISAPSSAQAGESIAIEGGGFDPNETLNIELHSTPVTLASLTADASGNLSGNVTIPAATSPGAHQLVVSSAAGTATFDITIDAADVTAPDNVDTDSAVDDSGASSGAPNDEGDSATATVGEQLASTGPSDARGLMGIALLCAAAGAGLIALRRRVG